MKLLHATFATAGLAVIVGWGIWSTASDWKESLSVAALAVVAGVITRLAIPREKRRRAFERLNPKMAKHIRGE